MNYKVFLNNLLDVDTSIDWTFPFENKEDYFLEINNDVKIYLNELISNVAFSFLSKSLKNDMYRYLVDVRTIENNQVVKDIDQYFDDYYENIDDKFSTSKQTTEKLVEGILNWINVLDISVSNKIIKNIHLTLPTKNKYFWFYLIEKLYLSKMYDSSYYLINQIKTWADIADDDSLLEDVQLYKLMCLNEMKFHKNSRRQEEVISLAEDLEGYNNVSLIIKLEYYTLQKDSATFDKLIDENMEIIHEYNIDELINIFELSIICGATKSYHIVDSLLKSRDVPYYENSIDYDIYILLQAIYYGEISKVLKMIKKLTENYPDAYDFEHITWFYRKNKKVNSKIKSLLNNNF